MWTRGFPHGSRHWLDKAVIALSQERKDYPQLPTGKNRFKLDFQFDVNSQKITCNGSPFPRSHRMFISPVKQLTPPEHEIHKPTVAIMIRQEGDKVLRMVRSLKKHINSFIILDTGSKDGTPQQLLMYLQDLPGTIYGMPFVDFGTDRTALVHLAHQHYVNRATDNNEFSFVSQWMLLVDADYVLSVDSSNPDWTNSLKSKDHIEQFYVGTVENLEYWRPHVIHLKQKSRYEGRTHEYITHDRKPIVERLATLKINHIGDGKFGGLKSYKHSRDLVFLLMDALDGFDVKRSFEYIVRTAFLVQDYELSTWMSKELWSLKDVYPEAAYCTSQQYASALYRSIPTSTMVNSYERDRFFCKALSPILHGMSLVNSVRLESIAELFGEMIKYNEHSFISAFGSMFLFNNRNPGELQHSLFMDHYLHSVVFERHLSLASSKCHEYQLMSLYIYFEKLEKQTSWKESSERKAIHVEFESRLKDWNDNLSNEYILMTSSLRTRLSVLGTSKCVDGNLNEGYRLLQLCLSHIIRLSDLPPAILTWLEQDTKSCDQCKLPDSYLNTVLNSTFLQRDPLCGYKNGKRIVIGKIDVLCSEISMKLFFCSEKMSKSLFEQLSHLINAKKYWPGNAKSCRELLRISHSRPNSVCSVILKCVRLLLQIDDIELSKSVIQLSPEEHKISMSLKQAQLLNNSYSQLTRIERKRNISLVSVSSDIFTNTIFKQFTAKEIQNLDHETIDRKYNMVVKSTQQDLNLGCAFVTCMSTLLELNPATTNDNLFRIYSAKHDVGSAKEKPTKSAPENSSAVDARAITDSGSIVKPTAVIKPPTIGEAATINDTTVSYTTTTIPDATTINDTKTIINSTAITSENNNDSGASGSEKQYSSMGVWPGPVDSSVSTSKGNGLGCNTGQFGSHCITDQVGQSSQFVLDVISSFHNVSELHHSLSRSKLKSKDYVSSTSHQASYKARSTGPTIVRNSNLRLLSIT